MRRPIPFELISKTIGPSLFLGKTAAKPESGYGNVLATHYDDLFEHTAGERIHARQILLEPIMPGVNSACDLACGTGGTAREFARQGIKVFAADLSPAMCRITRKKARLENLPIRILRSDMRVFRLPESVDLITLEFNALNHLPHRRDLGSVFRNTWRALRPGGWLFFDVNWQRAFERIWPHLWWWRGDDYFVLMHGGYDRDVGKGWIETTWLIPHGNAWRQKRERVEEVHWTPSEIRSALRLAGFERIRAVDGARFAKSPPWNRRGCRTFFLAQKNLAV
jgi:SAM-dependent methyltransferase